MTISELKYFAYAFALFDPPISGEAIVKLFSLSDSMYFINTVEPNKWSTGTSKNP